MNTRSLLRKLGSLYPSRLAESYDRVGLMAGELKKETKSILLCLDFDEEVAPIALKERPDLILTHHPFLFGTKSRIFASDPKKKELFDLIEKEGLCIYSMHTNFDAGYPGMNDALAEALGLEDVVPLLCDKAGRGGRLPSPMKIEEFASYAKEKLKIPYALLLPYGKENIEKVALIGGAGWQSALPAQKEGYDVFLSGDIPHHGRRDIVRYGFNYLDMPHEVEKIFIPHMKKILLTFEKDLKIIEVDHEICPKVI